MSANDCTVRIAGLCKKYCKSLKRSALYTLADAVQGAVGLASHTERLRKGEFWALRDINLEVRRGDCLGVIGPNGSGKTTLLKLISGMIEPDRGRVEVSGRVGTLIQVGAGFHPQLTGRENVYVNGTILGMSRREIKRKFDAIVEFADIGEFLDSPVKFYSSGMLLRLGFAIAVHTEPDVLLIDEVLAVGDLGFRLKCYNWMTEFRLQQKVVVFVSHNEAAVVKHCNRTLLLCDGRTRFIGATERALDSYIGWLSETTRVGEATSAGHDGSTRILSVVLRDAHEQECKEFVTGGALLIDIHYASERSLEGGFAAFRIEARDGDSVFAATTAHQGVRLPETVGESRLRVRIPELPLTEGSYYVTALLNDSNEKNVAYANRAAAMRVKGPRPDNRTLAGHIYIKHIWERLP